MSWYEQISQHGVAKVALALGLQVVGVSGNVNRGISPCPSCSAEKRGRRDRRGPIGIRPDDRGWRCHRCDAHGDPVNLASWVLQGAYKPNGRRWRELQASCAVLGLCDSPQGPRLRVLRGFHGSSTRVCSSRKPELRTELEHRAVAQAVRPPEREVRDLWQACTTVTSDTEVTDWLLSRGLEPAACAAQDVVRALPPQISPPRWAVFGRPWTQSGHRVIAPMFGPQGKLETLHARSLRSRDPRGRDKAASPKGAQVAGTIMANRKGLDLLRRSREGGEKEVYDVTVLIAEGVPDFLTWATHGKADAVFGVIAGSWTVAFAERIPRNARVLIRTHDDKAGHKYAQQIGETLRERCRVFCRAKI